MIIHSLKSLVRWFQGAAIVMLTVGCTTPLSVDEGGSCTDSVDCSGSLLCVDGICTDGSGGSGGAGGGSGGRLHAYWKRRGDTTQLKFSGSNAWICTGGQTETPATLETVSEADGLYRMNVVNPDTGDINRFPIDVDDNELWLGVPGQYTATHEGAPYDAVSSYQCAGTSGGGGGGGQQTEDPPPNTCYANVPGCSGSSPFSCDATDYCYADSTDCAYDPACRR